MRDLLSCRRSGEHGFALALVIEVLFLALPAWAYADLLITKSNAPQYKVGTRLPDATRFELGPGCHVEALRVSSSAGRGEPFFMVPSAESLSFDGPPLPKYPIGGGRGRDQPPPC
jgi:hypothetical protein